MLKIHQPYKSKYVFAFASIGVLFLGSIVVFGSSEDAVYAAGDSRTIHDIENMQDMTQQICSNTKAGDTAVLTDKRSGYSIGTMTGSDGSIHNLNQYVVVKLKDENCWMQENLRLGDNSKILLTSNDSNVTRDYELPASSDGLWSNSDYAAQQMRIGEVGMTVSPIFTSSGKGWRANFGNYYSWCVATAGDCSEYVADNVNVPSSICPKNWILPSGGSVDGVEMGAGRNSEFYELLGGLNMPTIIESPYFFPAAGYVYSDGLRAPDNFGYYWSRTSNSDNAAYYLYFYSGGFYPGTSISERYNGFSVRCVAQGGLDKIEKPIWEENEDGNVNVTMPTVITIDAVAGMEDTAESNKIAEGTIIAKVSSNSEHKVMLSVEQPALRDKIISTAEISPTSDTNPVEPGNNAWGIWNGDTKLYDPITTTEQTYYETITDGVENQKIHTFGVGISISPSLPAGTYSTEVTVTAAVE